MKRSNMKDIFNTVGFFDSAQYGDIVYGALEDKNGFCAVDIKNHIAKYIGTFENEDISAQRLYHSIIIVEDCIILIPANACRIAIFDLKEGIMKYIKTPISSSNGLPSYRNIVNIDQCIYVMGDSKKDIIKLDITNLDYTTLCDFSQEFADHVESFFGEGCVISGNDVFVPLACKPSFIIFDKDFKNYRVVDLKLPIDGIGGIEQDGNIIWMVGRGINNNYLCAYDLSNSSIDSFEIPQSATEITYPYWKPICTERYIYIFPLLEKKAYMFSKETKIIKEIACINELIDINYDNSQFALMGIRKRMNKIYFILGKDFCWYEYDTDNNNVMKIDIDFCIEDKVYKNKYANEIVSRSITENTILSEKKLPLNLFLNEILEVKK